jgi:GNAT superfamily N-acetyltransferase
MIQKYIHNDFQAFTSTRLFLTTPVCPMLDISYALFPRRTMSKAFYEDVHLVPVTADDFSHLDPSETDEVTDNAIHSALEFSGYKILVVRCDGDEDAGVIYYTGGGATGDCRIVLVPRFRGQGIGPRAEVAYIRFMREVNYGIGFNNMASIVALAKAMEMGKFLARNQGDNSQVTSADLRRYVHGVNRFFNGRENLPENWDPFCLMGSVDERFFLGFYLTVYLA